MLTKSFRDVISHDDKSTFPQRGPDDPKLSFPLRLYNPRQTVFIVILSNAKAKSLSDPLINNSSLRRVFAYDNAR